MTTREAILRDIRLGLGGGAQASPTAPAARLRIPEVPMKRRIESMLERVTALGGHAVHAQSAADAVDYVARLTKGHSRVVADSPFLRDLGFLAGGADCATARFGITSADYALSDTGSLVMIASSANARLISLLPPVHIAMLPANCLLTGLDELYTLMPKPADVSSSMVFITGPSRTADIEQILVRGVHGPGEIHVVIID
jgi:L-lactate dehydrogenase complex protein LldG